MKGIIDSKLYESLPSSRFCFIYLAPSIDCLGSASRRNIGFVGLSRYGLHLDWVALGDVDYLP